MLAKPTARPPTTGQMIKVVIVGARAEPMAPARNISAATSMLLRRPIRSDSQPAVNAPKAEPSKAEATAKPRVSLETVKAVPIAPTAPLITAVS